MFHFGVSKTDMCTFLAYGSRFGETVERRGAVPVRMVQLLWR